MLFTIFYFLELDIWVKVISLISLLSGSVLLVSSSHFIASRFELKDRLKKYLKENNLNSDYDLENLHNIKKEKLYGLRKEFDNRSIEQDELFNSIDLNDIQTYLSNNENINDEELNVIDDITNSILEKTKTKFESKKRNIFNKIDKIKQLEDQIIYIENN